MIFIAMGSNLPGSYESSQHVLVHAVQKLREHVRVLNCSSIWTVPPVPFCETQPWYCNAVISVETDMNPFDLVDVLQNIEREFGARSSVRNAPRVLDLDIIDYHGQVHDTDTLVLPHPRMHERGFVLYPLQDICSNWRHPIFKASLADMIEAIQSSPHLSQMHKVEGNL